MVWADFDSDKRLDVALLIQRGSDRNLDYPERLDFLYIAVCRNTISGPVLHLIEKLYCGDGIAVSQRGRRYYDFERETEGVYSHDGVHAFCFEKAGATYQFEKGSFRRIVDSD
jgi:hypothetical protein